MLGCASSPPDISIGFMPSIKWVWFPLVRPQTIPLHDSANMGKVGMTAVLVHIPRYLQKFTIPIPKQLQTLKENTMQAHIMYNVGDIALMPGQKPGHMPRQKFRMKNGNCAKQCWRY